MWRHFGAVALVALVAFGLSLASVAFNTEGRLQRVPPVPLVRPAVVPVYQGLSLVQPLGQRLEPVVMTGPLSQLTEGNLENLEEPVWLGKAGSGVLAELQQKLGAEGALGKAGDWGAMDFDMHELDFIFFHPVLPTFSSIWIWKIKGCQPTASDFRCPSNLRILDVGSFPTPSCPYPFRAGGSQLRLLDEASGQESAAAGVLRSAGTRPGDIAGAGARHGAMAPQCAVLRQVWRLDLNPKNKEDIWKSERQKAKVESKPMKFGRIPMISIWFILILSVYRYTHTNQM